MERSKLFWGVFLIFAGLLIVLARLDILDYEFSNVIGLWPMFLIFWGLSLFKLPEYIRYAITVLSAVFLAIFLYAVITSGFRVAFDKLLLFDKPAVERILNESIGELSEAETVVAYDSTYHKGNLNVKFAAGSFNLFSSTAHTFRINGNSYNYDFDTLNHSKAKGIDLTISSPAGKWQKGKDSDKFYVDLAIGKGLIWDMVFNFGACVAEIDLTNISYNQLEINSGAASIDLKLGNSDVSQKVVINSGASSFNILIPSDSFCKLKSKTVLSTENLNKFIKRGDYYILNDKTDGASVIEIELKGAVSEFNIMLF